jgi:hypothetical protein
VLETSFGCNLLQLVEKREFVPLGYEEARGQLRKELFDLHMQQEYVEFIDKLRSQTYVERKGLFAETAQLGTSDPGALGGVDLLP